MRSFGGRIRASTPLLAPSAAHLFITPLLATGLLGPSLLAQVLLPFISWDQSWPESKTKLLLLISRPHQDPGSAVWSSGHLPEAETQLASCPHPLHWAMAQTLRPSACPTNLPEISAPTLTRALLCCSHRRCRGLGFASRHVPTPQPWPLRFVLESLHLIWSPSWFPFRPEPSVPTLPQPHKPSSRSVPAQGCVPLTAPPLSVQQQAPALSQPSRMNQSAQKAGLCYSPTLASEMGPRLLGFLSAELL